MVDRPFVVRRQDPLPVLLGMKVAVLEHGHEEVPLEPARPRPPDAEIAIAPCLEREEKHDEDADQQKRQWRGVGRGIGDRERHAERDHRPVRRGVEPCAPDCRPVDFTPVEMRESSDFCGGELGRLLRDAFFRHDRSSPGGTVPPLFAWRHEAPRNAPGQGLSRRAQSAVAGQLLAAKAASPAG